MWSTTSWTSKLEISLLAQSLFFGGKSSHFPPLHIQDIIHTWSFALSKVIANDPAVAPHLQVVVVENYNVTAASYLIPASDISEQISLLHKKLQVLQHEIHVEWCVNTVLWMEQTWKSWIGWTWQHLHLRWRFRNCNRSIWKSAYKSADFYEREAIKPLVDFIIAMFLQLVTRNAWLVFTKELINKDWFMTLATLTWKTHCNQRTHVGDYEDRDAWLDQVIVNIAKAGFFSSDRTIAQYNEDIWHLN